MSFAGFLSGFLPEGIYAGHVQGEISVVPAGCSLSGRLAAAGQGRMAGETGGACCQKRRTAIRKEESSKAARQRETGSGKTAMLCRSRLM